MASVSSCTSVDPAALIDRCRFITIEHSQFVRCAEWLMHQRFPNDVIDRRHTMITHDDDRVIEESASVPTALIDRSSSSTFIAGNDINNIWWNIF